MMKDGKDPEVTVLMACFNAERWLAEAIESVLLQTHATFEFIIIDDGSTDATLGIVRRYEKVDSRIKAIAKANTGLADSLNFGLRHARGKWIARLDADDIALPNRLRNQLNFVEANNDNVSLVGGGCIEIDETGAEIKEHNYPSDHNMLVKRLEINNKFFPHSSAFFNRQMVIDLGGYNQRFSRSQDCDLWLRIGETGKIACLDVQVVKLRKHTNMLSNTNDGRLQTIMRMCAVICYLRRKEGLSDPSRMEENRWKEFLAWVENRMQEECIFQERKSWQAIRDAYYNHKENKFERAKAVFSYLTPEGLKAIWQQFFRINIALELAQESKKVW